MIVIDLIKKYKDKPEEIIDIMKKDFNSCSKLPDLIVFLRTVTEYSKIDFNREEFIKIYKNKYPDEEFEEVCLSLIADNKPYSLALIPWEEFLGLEVKIEDDIDELIAISGIIYELTWFGWKNEDINQNLETLEEITKDFEENYLDEDGKIISEKLINFKDIKFEEK